METEGPSPKSSAASLFAERFADFFKCGVFPAITLGLVFAWVWMGLTEGYPIFMDGHVDLLSVMIVLGSFSAVMLALGFLPQPYPLAQKPIVWLLCGAIMAAACLGMLWLYYATPTLSPTVEFVLVRSFMALLGIGTAVIVMGCAVGCARLQPASAGVGFTFSIAVTFVAFFCLNACSPLVRGVLFCLLPLGASAAMLQGRHGLADRMGQKPEKELPFARGFKSMCLSFAVFFFAIGAKCALEPVIEFGVAADTSVIGVLVVSLAFFYAIALAPRPVGVFRALKLAYSVAVMVLTICIAIAPLSIEPYVGILYNADVMVMIMVLWLLTCFVAHHNEAPVSKVVGLALGLAVLGLALGWLVGTLLHQALGHDRMYPTIALACATAVFSTVGFSGNSFPLLTHHGEGAKKKAKAVEPYRPADFCAQMAAQCHLSDREREVLELLVVGHGADAVSEKLVISYHTARTHVRNIYKKMDIHSQRELLDAYEGARAAHGGESASAPLPPTLGAN